MSRVHPTLSKTDGEELATTTARPSIWTVWNKSSMGFHGTDGFSIYDSKGRLAFRVDNYSRKHKCFAGQLLLMDANGKALMALRPRVGTVYLCLFALPSLLFPLGRDRSYHKACISSTGNPSIVPTATE